VPIRHERMLTSPFAFFRGSAAIMAADLAGTPVTGLRVQLCGDAHLSNFGGFAAPDRSLVFDLNDFDETLPGPWEWDIKRLAASVEVAGRDRGFAADAARDAVLATVRAYREAVRAFAEMRTIDSGTRGSTSTGSSPSSRSAYAGRAGARWRRTSRRRAPRTVCARCRSSRTRSTASHASSATRRSSCP
jgi:uncharacterized protein (DUF2252 family)